MGLHKRSTDSEDFDPKPIRNGKNYVTVSWLVTILVGALGFFLSWGVINLWGQVSDNKRAVTFVQVDTAVVKQAYVDVGRRLNRLEVGQQEISKKIDDLLVKR